MLGYVWIAVGSALGGVARQWCTLAAARAWGPDFPWGTISINVVGSFAIGFIATYTDANGPMPASLTMRQFLMVGLCGGYTTFSSFSLQTLLLLRERHLADALLNIVGSVVVCLIAVTLGHLLATIGQK